MSIKAQNTNMTLLKKSIFDPFSTIIKLAILANKSEYSKLSINDNIILIQEYGYKQTFSRYYYGDSKGDIHMLSIPIELACERYLTEDIINRIPRIKIVFKCAQNGLNKLIDTYSAYPLITDCLKYYYSIIDNKLVELEKKTIKPIIINYGTSFNSVMSQLNSPRQMIMKNEKHDLELGEGGLSDIKTFLDNSNIHKKSKSKHKKDDEVKKPDIVITNTDIKEQEQELDQNKDPDQNKDTFVNEPKKNPELRELYSKEIIDKFNELWIDSKINIIIEMIEYLLKESTPTDYAACIETFMIPIDKDVLKIIN